MRRLVPYALMVLTSCANSVTTEDGEYDVPQADCEVSSDCPTTPPESCRSVACDWTGARTSEGYPRGCFLVVKEIGAYCYWKTGSSTCPGVCGGPDSGSVCQAMEPHCGGYH